MSGTKRITNARIERIEKKLELVDETQDTEIEEAYELRKRVDDLDIQVEEARKRLTHIAECMTVAEKNIGRMEEKLFHESKEGEIVGEELAGRIRVVHDGIRDSAAVVNDLSNMLHARMARIESMIPNPGVLRRGAGVLAVILVLLVNSYLVHSIVTYNDGVNEIGAVVLSGMLGLCVTLAVVGALYLIGELITYIKEG